MASKFYKFNCPRCDDELLVDVSGTPPFSCPHCYQKIELCEIPDGREIIYDIDRGDTLIAVSCISSAPYLGSRTAIFLYILAGLFILSGLFVALLSDGKYFLIASLPAFISAALLVAAGKFLTYAKDIAASQRDQASSLRKLAGQSKTSEDK